MMATNNTHDDQKTTVILPARINSLRIQALVSVERRRAKGRLRCGWRKGSWGLWSEMRGEVVEEVW